MGKSKLAILLMVTLLLVSVRTEESQVEVEDEVDESVEEPDLADEIHEELVIDFEEDIEQTDIYVSLPYFRLGEWDQPTNIKTIDELLDGFEGRYTPTILLIYQNAKLATKIINELMGGQVGGMEIYNDLVRIFGLECAQFNKMKKDLIFENELDLEACETGKEMYLPRLGVQWIQPSEDKEEEQVDFVLQYYSGENKPALFVQWLNENVPNYSHDVRTHQELKKFAVKNPKKDNLIIFSRQDSTEKIAVNIAARYFATMDVAFINCTEIDENKLSLIDKFEILEFPSFLIVKDFADGNMDTVRYDNFINYKLVIEFLDTNLKTEEQILAEEEEEIEEEDDESSVILIDDQNYEFYIFQENKAVMLHITDGEQQFHLWKGTRQIYPDELVYGEVNCDDGKNFYLCERIFQSPTMPSMIYFTPTVDEKRKEMQFFEEDDLLQDDIDDIIFESFAKYVDKGRELKNYNEAEQVIMKVLSDQSICVLYMHDWETIPLGYLALGVNIQQLLQFHFVHMKKPPEKLLKQFNLQYDRLPMLTIFGMTADNINANEKHKEEEKMHASFSNFKGKYSYREIYDFITKEIHPYVIPDRKPEQFKITMIYTKLDLADSCGLTDLCIIVIFDGSGSHESIGKHYDQYQLAVKNLKTTGINFVFLDGHVHTKVLSYFNLGITQFPSIVAYRPESFTTIKPEEQPVVKTQTIKKFIYAVIEEDWGLSTDEKDIPVEQVITGNVREFYTSYE